MGIVRTTMPMPYKPYMLHPTMEGLCFAIRAGKESEVRWCIENGVDVNEEVHLAAGGKATPLSLAVKNGRMAIVESLLKGGAQPDACVDTTAAEGGLTSLMQAVRDGRAPMARLLMNYGAEPYYALKYVEDQHMQLSPNMHWQLLLWPSMTPTAIAAVEGHVDELTELLYKGADPMEEIKFPGCEKKSSVVSLAGCEVVCERLCGKKPSDDALQTL